MSTIQPPPASPTSAIPPTQVALPTVTVNNATAELVQLTPGTQVSAQVATIAQRGTAEIQTPLGKFIVETPLNLKVDQTLLLQVAPKPTLGGSAITLYVLEIAGKPLTGIHTLHNTVAGGFPTVTDSTPGNIAGSTTPNQAGSTILTLSVGSTIGATLLTSSPAFTITADGKFALAPSTTPPLAGGNQTGVPLSGQSTATSSPLHNSPPLPHLPLRSGTTAAPGGTPLPSITQGVQSGTIIQHTAGSRLMLNIQSISPPAPERSIATVTNAPATPLTPGLSLTGIVSGATITGHTVVHTPTVTMSIATAQPLPPGTEITFRIETMPSGPDRPHAFPPSLHRDSMMATQTWSSLEESLVVLQDASPSTASQITNHTIPKLNVQFTATALFFLSALRSGDVRSWIGDGAAKILERARPDAMKRLGDDFRAMSAIDEDTGSTIRTSDWRGTLIPFQSHDGLEHIRLYTRQLHNEDENEEQRITGNRFLIDVTLSNIGRLQLDGMIEKLDKRLDLIVRTSNPLPMMVRTDMMALFSKSNEIVGMHGGMSFQATPDVFVDVNADIHGPDSGLGITV